jgi:hypothetical protein
MQSPQKPDSPRRCLRRVGSPQPSACHLLVNLHTSPPTAIMPSLRQKLRSLIKGDPVSQQVRRRKFATIIYNNLPLIQYVPLTTVFWLVFHLHRAALLLVGLVWLVFIPFPGFGQRTYIDENALQPGQVSERIRQLNKPFQFGA